jgi:hypothetical protein
MSDPAFSNSAFAAYAAAIRQSESSDNYGVVNSLGYMGAYQVGQLALTDAGFQDANGNWTPLAKSFGVNSKETLSFYTACPRRSFSEFYEKELRLSAQLSILCRKDSGWSLNYGIWPASRCTLDWASLSQRFSTIGRQDSSHRRKSCSRYAIYEAILRLWFYFSTRLIWLFTGGGRAGWYAASCQQNTR